MNRKDWKKTMILPRVSVRDAMQIMDKSALQIAFVVDGENRLLGAVTDGDVRRSILRGEELSAPVERIMNAHPIIARQGMERAAIFRLMTTHGVQQIPLLDGEGRLVGLAQMEELLCHSRRDNAVVLMAGGLGTRLRPLTDKIPKPLLKVGAKPILETILESFLEAGFHRFYFAVNYKSQMIEDYFGDGSRFGAEIEYLHEKKRMGTAGALYFLPKLPDEPIIVMNGDLLTKVDFGEMLDYHVEQNAVATMAVREYNYQVPYGVIDFDGDRIQAIREKPSYSFFVNAGIYVLSPEAAARVDKEEFFDMPQLFDALLADGKKTTAYPIREYWLDIGRMDDFERAQEEYGDKFAEGRWGKEQ